jgi:hypothetical protein
MILLKFLEFLAIIVFAAIVIINVLYQIIDNIFNYADNNILSFSFICLIIVVIVFVSF